MRPVHACAATLALFAPNLALAQWAQTTSAGDVELFKNRAEVSVMVSIENPTETAIEAQLGVSIGEGAATGLAMRSPLGANLWSEGELDRGEAALARYLKMSPTPVSASPLSAILSWTSAGYLDLRMSVPARKTQFVSYKFVAPVTYAAGVYRYELPQLDASIPGFVNVHLADKKGTLTIDDVASPDGIGRVRIDASHVLTYTVPTTEPAIGEIAILPTKEGEAYVDFHVDLSPHVAEVPEDARVVVLLDASRSVSAEDGAAIVSAARSYLHAFDGHDARVALVTFDRGARVLGADPTAPFAASADADTTLGALTLPRGNGSNLDVALAKATELLAAEAGPKRVVLFTDLATADRLVPADLTAKVPGGAILHIARIHAAYGALSRDDETPWAALPKATGGLAWEGAASEDDEHHRSVFEELARPKRLENARVAPVVDGMKTELGAVPEGTRISSAAFRAPVDTAVLTVDGELWSQPFHKVFAPSASYRKLAASFVFANSTYEHLDPEALVTFANVARVVTPVTSLVTKDAANAPFELETFGTGGFGGIGIGSSSCGCCGVGIGTTGTLGSGFDPEAWLHREVGAIKVACDSTGGGEVDVESTLDEIVDVHVTGASTDAASTCIAERVWSLTLDAAFRSFDHRTWRM